MGRQSKNKGSPKPKRPREVKFINLTNTEASGQKPTGILSSSQLATKVCIEQLGHTPIQLKTIKELYNTSAIMDKVFNTTEKKSQSEAASLLKDNGLDEESRGKMDSKWSTVWSDRKTGKGENEMVRILYRCICGYNHETAGQKTRKTMMEFTGCLAHAEITYSTRQKRVLRVRGYLTHNQECLNAEAVREPNWPLHPSVLDVAVAQLNSGARFADLQAKNLSMHETFGYKDMPQTTTALQNSPYRWILLRSDARSIYRKRDRQLGIDAETKAHINIHNWLDKDSPHYNATLANAIFHYAARSSKNERFEICIATEDMREAAWKHGLYSQIILDGTFGVCVTKLLLFIVMAIDPDGHGEPLAFLLFSPPSKNRFTAAGYNNEILTKLLTAWKDSFLDKYGSAFEPKVVITDTDLTERRALLNVWPSAWLLLCKFHLRQSWTNHLNTSVKSTSPLANNLRQRLKRVEEGIISANSIVHAREIIATEIGRVTAQRPCIQDVPDGSALEDGAQKHLIYLRDYWTTDSLWPSWSDYGRKYASTLLKCEVKGVLTTTNHLESFNGTLKRTYLARQQRNGHRMRPDALICALVMNILPGIYKQRRFERNERDRKLAFMRKMKGGEALVAQTHRSPNRTGNGDAGKVLVAYFVTDERRDTDAAEILQTGQIGIPSFEDSKLIFPCYSSLAVETDQDPVKYYITLHLTGIGNCTCMDFKTRGGACKHIRAALLLIDELRERMNIPVIPFPSSATAALDLQRRCSELGLGDLVDSNGVAAASSTGTETKAEADKRVDRVTDIAEQTPIQQAIAAVEDILEQTGVDGVEDEEDGGSNCGECESDVDLENNEAKADGNEGSTLADMKSPPEIDAPNSDEFDFSVLRETKFSVVKAGIDEQTWSRVNDELNVASPKLYMLGKFLEGATPANATLESVTNHLGNVLVLANQLQSLADYLRKKEEAYENATIIEQPAQRPMLTRSPATPKKRVLEPVEDILAPSPESKKQKRHKSYSKH